MWLTESQVNSAIATTPWDLGNKLLYQLCLDHPHHTKSDEVIAKIWLIGRAYAVAIERRRNIKNLKPLCYVNDIGPAICNSQIDNWMEALSKISECTIESLPKILSTHREVMKLFRSISGQDKRSLASKYLHFHFPNLFFIYDTRAVKGISMITNDFPKCKAYLGPCDNDYRKYAEKCVRLRDKIAASFNKRLSPRQLDNLILDL